jgi:DNA modification methylase
MGRIVEAFSKSGQTVLDPFAGGGTTGAVALLLGRKFIGIDRDAKAIAKCRGRLEQHRERRPDSPARQQGLSGEDGS